MAVKTFSAFIQAAGITIRDIRGWRVHPDIVTRAFEIAIRSGDPRRRLPYFLDMGRIDGRFVTAAHEAIFDDDDIEDRWPDAAATMRDVRREDGPKDGEGPAQTVLIFDDATVQLVRVGTHTRYDQDVLRLVGAGASRTPAASRGTAIASSRSRLRERDQELCDEADCWIAGQPSSWRRADRLMGLVATCAPTMRERGRTRDKRADELRINTGTAHGSYVFIRREGSDWFALDPHEEDVPDWFVEAIQTIEARFQVTGSSINDSTAFRHDLPGDASATLAAARAIKMGAARDELAIALMRLGAPRDGALARVAREALARSRADTGAKGKETGARRGANEGLQPRMT